MVVFISGCWDLLHIGHLNILEKCKALGDYLVVGVNADELVEYLKGRPPIIPLEQRVRVIGELRCVDAVFRRDTLFDAEKVDEYNIKIFVCSPDYGQLEEHHKNLSDLAERKVQVVVIPRTPDISSQKIKEDCREKECLIKGKVDFIDKSGAIYIGGRELQHMLKRDDNIVVYKQGDESS